MTKPSRIAKREQPKTKEGKPLSWYYEIGEFHGIRPTWLAKKHGISVDHARKAQDFRRLFAVEDFKSCFPAKGSGGKELTWTHIRHLVSVEDDQARRQYVKDAVKGCWTVNRLSDEIRIAMGTQPSRRRGRRAIPAATIELAIMQLQKMSAQWIESCRATREALGLPEGTSARAAMLETGTRTATNLCDLTAEQMQLSRDVFKAHQKALSNLLVTITELDSAYLGRISAARRQPGKR